ncbi:Thiamine-phosphate synthase OS=Tsukamurella paurometabola (strain ATCC 8368 / DSM / CCUG 35730/ CIP 100753 / JCM 10117 / KCTC 9821 / NBRC 16120 / NCIMB 702349 / NCTC 13040) OX=521096 GN=thiE PE=3 SV=1 [Tsukamurella paurometabola]|uniref:Thiamine-phosphate synthase n=1 Tax=Tsukamurella paurometabola (strain ATCC 8368 / DSM 20162 / CCUG 35730 / CIP 100753 / JCM 10117 / KCTC 9821 / NBRC 16120 / NCIMB 702349 / NCTC 13040) TaxID=521096 RepID=D5UYM4_TSUPD|nr:thiamine phosphate synthase [Tsukamurella paurometabola]ADG80327.1 thiamine-phosphate pyrophosphorylase [Tsukamurella paurometabola DSM 20162]SUP39261.1 Thiamine-phosphate synthase [Tsukamurella paurometabola]
MVSPRDRLDSARLYLCTDARRERGDLAEFVAAALRGGVDIVQLRDKGSAGEREYGPLEAKQEIELVSQLREIAHAHDALVAVNDRADIAFAARADVLHLGQDDLPVAVARRIVGDEVVIGRSTHDADQATAAATETGVDYFCTGPCWPTPTKPGRTAPGLDLVRATATAAPARKWFAIGGIDLDRVPEVSAAGADAIVVVRAITAAADPEAAARALRAAVSG